MQGWVLITSRNLRIRKKKSANDCQVAEFILKQYGENVAKEFSEKLEELIAREKLVA